MRKLKFAATIDLWYQGSTQVEPGYHSGCVRISELILEVTIMERILLGHGSGGRLMYQLIRDHFVPKFGMRSLNHSAVLPV